MTEKELFQQQTAERLQLLGENAHLLDAELAQEYEVRKLSENWTKNWQDIKEQAATDGRKTLELLADEVPPLYKGEQEIPVDAALLAARKIFLTDNRQLGVKATNMKRMSRADLEIAALSLNRSIHATFLGFKDLADPGAAIADYEQDSTQWPSRRDPRLRMRRYTARLPLSMTAARVIMETKSSFKLTQYVHDPTSNNGVFNVGEEQEVPLSSVQVEQWKGEMTPYRGGLKFSQQNINEGEYTLQSAAIGAAEWAVSVERLYVTACTDMIKGNSCPTETLTWSSLSVDDLLEIALTYAFTSDDYQITTLAMSDKPTYIKYAKIDRSSLTQESERSDVGTATGRDNFATAPNRDVFAHPDGGIAANNALGWDAGETINMHVLEMNMTSAMEVKQNPAMVCFYWGAYAAPEFERKEGTPRVLFN